MWEALYLIMGMGLFVFAGFAVAARRRDFKDRAWAARVRKWEPDTRLESEFLEILRRLGYREPMLQVPIRAERLYQLDFAYTDERIAIEVDGPHHDAASQMESDRERDRHLLEAGWRTIRIPYFVIHRGEIEVGRLLRESGIPVATNKALFEARVLSVRGLVWPRTTRILIDNTEVVVSHGYPEANVLVLIERDSAGERWEVDRPTFRALKARGWRIAVVAREMILHRPAEVANWLNENGIRTLGEVESAASDIDGDDLPF